VRQGALEFFGEEFAHSEPRWRQQSVYIIQLVGV
jgi:hypothetical protein